MVIFQNNPFFVWRGYRGGARGILGGAVTWEHSMHGWMFTILASITFCPASQSLGPQTKSPKSPYVSDAPWGAVPLPRSPLGCRIWQFDPAPLPVGSQRYPHPSPRSWSLIFQEAATPAGLFQSGVCAHPWSGGVGGRARDISASPVRPQSTFLCPASSFQEHFLCIPEGSLRERHVLNSFSFTWGLLETRKVL